MVKGYLQNMLKFLELGDEIDKIAEKHKDSNGVFYGTTSDSLHEIIIRRMEQINLLGHSCIELIQENQEFKKKLESKEPIPDEDINWSVYPKRKLQACNGQFSLNIPKSLAQAKSWSQGTVLRLRINSDGSLTVKQSD